MDKPYIVSWFEIDHQIWQGPLLSLVELSKDMSKWDDAEKYYHRFLNESSDNREQRPLKLYRADAHAYATSRGARSYALQTFGWWCKNTKETN
jgi:hypothetical protein